MRIFLTLLLLFMSSVVWAHEGHHHHHETNKTTIANVQVQGPAVTSLEISPWTKWLGSFHLIFLHFPIALINLLVISELLGAWSKRPLYEYSARFMAIAAAILALPTALLGFIFSYSAPYSGTLETLLEWHMWLGFFTAIIAIITAILREKVGLSATYYSFLFVLFLSVNIGANIGGKITFG